MARLRTAKLLANYARQCETDEQIYSTFKMEFLSSTISETAAAVKHVSTIAHETGFAQAVEDNLEPLVTGLKLGNLPAEEVEVLRALGSADPRGDLLAMIFSLRSSGGRIGSETDDRIKSKLDNASLDLKLFGFALEKVAAL